MGNNKPISPGRRRAWHQLAIQAEAHVKGQDILFKGPARYNFPKGRLLSEEELPALRSYIAERTKLSLEYSVTSRGVTHPAQLELEVGQPVSLQNFESVVSHTMQAWKYGSDEGKIGMYFMPCGDDSVLESTNFRAVEFTPDCTGKISPSRDEELRHKLTATLDSYFNKDNVVSDTFPTLATRADAAVSA